MVVGIPLKNMHTPVEVVSLKDIRRAGRLLAGFAAGLDEDFLEALEYGMPPAAGLGVGIDRIVAIAAKRDSLKEAILFPTLKNK